MCGIFGITGSENDLINCAKARSALTSIRHRGPDDEGYLLINSVNRVVQPCRGHDTDPSLELPDIESFEGKEFNIVLGHRRLSIIDLSPLGHQPMESLNARYWIVFNGEIYNYLELRAELIVKGYEFRTETDTEVILAAYQEWGAKMLVRFIGMFAFAIFDLHESRVFLARDCFGIKPLYYSNSSGKFAFASEIKALLDVGWVTRKVNPQRMFEFLRFASVDYGTETFFSDVHQLPPAHYIELRLDSDLTVTPVCYWDIDLSKKRDISFGEAVATTRSLFEESVGLHMRSDVPVGSCLSGGLDSSAIVAYMRKLSRGEQDIHTFSYIDDHPIHGEEKYVDIINASYSTIGHKVKPSSLDIVNDINHVVYIQEQPFMSTSIYAQHRVFRLAHESGIKVMLDGQGADEIFAGYYNMLGARITSLLSKGNIVAAWRIVQGAPQNMKNHRLKMLVAAFGRTMPSRCTDQFSGLVGQPLWPTWLNREWFDGHGVIARHRLSGHGKDALREELLHSIQELSLPNLLRFEDRNSMSYSIESRVPFCNPKLAEFALSLPDNCLISNDGTTKAVFRQAMRGILPDAVLDREKVGFATPERDWLSSLRPWIETTLQSEEAKAIPFFNHEMTRNMINAELQSQNGISNYSWRCLNVMHWARVYKITF